jgi:hypothetical protein
LYLYCNVDKTVCVMIRLIVVVETCVFLKFRINRNFLFGVDCGGMYSEALTATDSVKFPSLTAVSDGSIT